MVAPGALWAKHAKRWRNPAEVLSFPPGIGDVDRRLLRFEVRGRWWETLAALGILLLVTREYEHLFMALGVLGDMPEVSYLPLPHPSGLAIDRAGGSIYLASTRNPNQVFELLPAADLMGCAETEYRPLGERPLLPVRSWLYPGSLYIHDLAIVGGRLYANAVGQNAVVLLGEGGGYERVWWPRCIERDGSPVFDHNLIQLNSIAAGEDIGRSFFTASTDRPSSRRPGHRNFPVDRRGVVFSGETREVVARGLTRPHSARLHGGRLWVNDSGYGRLVTIEGGELREVARFPGWTRGLSFCGHVAFVGTSRVIPRFQQYAPGLRVHTSECAVHAFDLAMGEVLGSIVWPAGNQIFAVEWLPADQTSGLPFRGARRRPGWERTLFYAFRT